MQNPTYFIEEFGFSKGRFVALSLKCYFSLNMEDGTVKMGSKGVPHSANLELDMYLRRLYMAEAFYVELQSLRLIKKGQM